MKRTLCMIALIALSCGSGEADDNTTFGALDGSKADWNCEEAKFEYCVDEMKLDEATCKKKVAAWCSDDDTPGK